MTVVAVAEVQAWELVTLNERVPPCAWVVSFKTVPEIIPTVPLALMLTTQSDCVPLTRSNPPSMMRAVAGQLGSLTIARSSMTRSRTSAVGQLPPLEEVLNKSGITSPLAYSGMHALPATNNPLPVSSIQRGRLLLSPSQAVLLPVPLKLKAM